MTDQKLDDYQRVIALSRYSRWSEDKQRRETWPETVDRALDWLTNHVNCLSSNNVSAGLKKELRDAMIRMDVLPSMRLLQYAGPAMDNNVTRMFNCTAMRFDNVRAFDETVFLSMSGCGVGGRITKDNVDKLPVIPENIVDAPDYNYVVEDSLEGWATAVRLHMDSLYKGRIMSFDTSLIREKGARLVTSGGFAPGPKLLVELLERITEIFLKAKGRKLWTIEVYKIFTKIAGVVVAGGSRRSALITLFSPNDREMTESKKGDWWNSNPSYAYSNNSASFWGQPDMKTFFEFWRDVYHSGAGEPGFVNGKAAKMQAEKFDRDTVSNQLLLNPCQPASATVLTEHGITTFSKLNIGDKIWDGKCFTKVTNKVCTGVKPVQRYETTAGVFVGTKEHRVVERGIKVEAQYAQDIDICVGPEPKTVTHDPQTIMDGLVLGDGGVHKASNNLRVLYIGHNDCDYHTSEVAGLIVKRRTGIKDTAWEIQTTVIPKELTHIKNRDIPDRYLVGNVNQTCSLLRGLYSANGSICGSRVTYKTVNKDTVNKIMLLLSSVGIASYYTTNKPVDVEFSNGVYTLSESYDINIGTVLGRWLFEKNIGFLQQYKNIKLGKISPHEKPVKSTGKTTYEVRDVVSLGDMEVFDITVDDAEHVYWTGGLKVSNCAEIFSFETTFLCNLTGVNIRPEDDLKALKDKIRLASILGYWQATVTDFKYIRKEWRDNAEKEMLLGVSLSGICDHPVLNKPDAKSAELLQIMRSHSKNTADRWANKLGKKKTVSWTTVKPSGNSAQLSGVSSGIHPAYSRYYIRRIQQNTDDPLTQFLKDQGVPHENSKYAANTTVFAFPREAPPTARLASEMTALEQLELWLHYKRNYTTHTVSMTCYVDQHEWLEVGAWVFKHFEELIGVSFLPKNDHTYEQAPYQAIEEKEYRKLVEDMPDLNWDQFVESTDNTNVTDKVECSGAGCTLSYD